jgi:hypothetical protein
MFDQRERSVEEDDGKQVDEQNSPGVGNCNRKAKNDFDMLSYREKA